MTFLIEESGIPDRLEPAVQLELLMAAEAAVAADS
jgi:hypothetical protein